MDAISKINDLFLNIIGRLCYNIRAGMVVAWRWLESLFFAVKGGDCMERAIDVAQYIFDRYTLLSGERELNEMKLHKLLYLSQRESYAITGEPLFSGDFYGWKYGPVCKEVRYAYSRHGMMDDTIRPISCEAAYIVNNIVAQYGGYESWKLSELSHRESSWLNARKGIAPGQNGDRRISPDDIKRDATKVRPYDSVYDMYYDEFDDAEVLA